MNSILNKTLAVAAAVVLLSSCKKEQDPLTNISAFRKDASQAETINAATVNTKMILADRVNGVDYIITQNMLVNAELVIEPGVTIMFKDGAGLQVGEQGSLTAIGEKSNTIYFTSESGKRGAWKGIVFLSNSAKNVLAHSKIEHGGGAGEYGSANLIIGAGSKKAQAEVSNCEIMASKTDGIALSKGSKLNYFDYNKVSTNTAYAVTMFEEDIFPIAATNQFVNNGKDGINVIGNDNGFLYTPVTFVKKQ
jgi:hypothetical protein